MVVRIAPSSTGVDALGQNFGGWLLEKHKGDKTTPFLSAATNIQATKEGCFLILVNFRLSFT